MRIFFALFLASFFSLAALAADLRPPHKKEAIEPTYIIDNAERKIEYFCSKPEGEGPFPVIFLVHGSQPPDNSLGGKQLVAYGYLERFVKEGIAAVAISMPGYGGSGGPRDRAGPNSQQAIGAVISYFKSLPYVDEERMGLYGISLGADLAGMVSTLRSDLFLQILESGRYDLASVQSLPNYLSKITESVANIVGDDEEAMLCRSPALHSDKIHCVSLFLHGELDDRRGLPHAKSLHEHLLTLGKESTLMIFPGQTHCLSQEKWSVIFPFLREKFFGRYGIGITVSDPIPALQVVKIHSGSPAEASGKIQLGDAILRISPNNDDIEIDAVDMPPQKFVALVLGKKGTNVRLLVQHYDLSYESIVLTRDSY